MNKILSIYYCDKLSEIILFSYFGYQTLNSNTFKEISKKTVKIEGGIQFGIRDPVKEIIYFRGTGLTKEFPVNRLVLFKNKVKTNIISLNEKIERLNYSGNYDRLLLSTLRNCYIYNTDKLSLATQIPFYFSLVSELLPNNDYLIIGLSFNKLNIDLQVKTNEKTNKLNVHHKHISNIAINKEGTFIATCNSAGKYIKIYNLKTFTLVKTFNRGLTSKTISFLNFSENSEYLLVATESGSIHIFQLLENINYLYDMWGLYHKSNYNHQIDEPIVFMRFNDNILLVITYTKFYLFSVINEKLQLLKKTLIIYKANPFLEK